MGGYFAKAWSYPWQDGQTIGVLTLSRVSPVRILPVPTKYREFGDDIALSFYLSKGKKGHHIVTNKLNGKVKNLLGSKGPMAQQSKENWDQIRTNVLNEYFNTSSHNDNIDHIV